MSFEPRPDDELSIDNKVYRVAGHPKAPGAPYAQWGHHSVVYQLIAAEGGQRLALKVFNPRFRAPSIIQQTEHLRRFATLPGLTACHRLVLTMQRHAALLQREPDLNYAVLMPWLVGPTWLEILLSRQTLTPGESLAVARSLSAVLCTLEEQGLAHCDLAAENIVLPALAPGVTSPASTDVALVDLEHMYGPGLAKPPLGLSAVATYASRQAVSDGGWAPDADRFAGALLIAEMLGWCDTRVGEQAAGSAYFEAADLQRDTERYRTLTGTLRERWGDAPARLLERAWRSETLSDCPTFAEWLGALPALDSLEPLKPAVTLVDRSPASPRPPTPSSSPLSAPPTGRPPTPERASRWRLPLIIGGVAGLLLCMGCGLLGMFLSAPPSATPTRTPAVSAPVAPAAAGPTRPPTTAPPTSTPLPRNATPPPTSTSAPTVAAGAKANESVPPRNDMAAELAALNETLRANPNNLEARLKRIEIYLRMQDYDRAVQDVNKVIETMPSLSAAYSIRGQINASKGEHDAALADVNKAVQLDAKNADAYRIRGAIWLQDENLDAALADYNQALALNPDDDLAYRGRGLVHFYQGNFDAALADYNRAIQLKSDWPWRYAERGEVYAAKRDCAHASVDADQALQRDSKLGRAWYVRALCSIERDDLSQALDQLNQALLLDPSLGDAYGERGVIYTRMGDRDRALADLRKAVGLTTNPRNRIYWSDKLQRAGG